MNQSESVEYVLRVSYAAGEEITCPLGLQERLQIGRSRSSDIQVPNTADYQMISGRHCSVFRDGQGVWLEDSAARHPALVNDSVLSSNEKRKICTQDVICLARGSSVMLKLLRAETPVHTQDVTSGTLAGNVEETIGTVGKTVQHGAQVADRESVPEVLAETNPVPEDVEVAIDAKQTDEYAPLTQDSSRVELVDGEQEQTQEHREAWDGMNVTEGVEHSAMHTVAPTVYADLLEVTGTGMESFDAGDGDDKTVFVDPAALEKERTFHAVLWIVVAGMLLLLFLLFGMKMLRGKPKTSILYDGEYFSAQIPSDWEVSALGKMVLLSPAGKTQTGVALLKNESPDIRFWTYAENVDVMFGMLGESNVQFLNEITWEPETDPNSPDSELLLKRTHIVSIPYVLFRGYAKGRNGRSLNAVARFYLFRDNAIMVIAWGDKRALMSAHSVFDSVEIDGNEYAWVDRRAPARKELSTSDSIETMLDEGDKWLEKSTIAYGNGWRAYACYLRAYRALLDLDSMSAEGIRERLWRSLQLSAERLNVVFHNHYQYISAAEKAGQYGKAMESAIILQQEIGDREDFRWLWAQTQRNQLQQRIKR